jgi:hypothetical protein
LSNYKYNEFIFLGLVLLSFALLGYLTLDLDHPFGVTTNSRALYVDGGFYSDAAQNWSKFGQWSFDYDTRHWPGAPFLSLVRALVFELFGVSLEAARFSSIILSLIGLCAFYFILRTDFNVYLSIAILVVSGLMISYVTHARSALAEPTATFFALLAILVFVRLQNRRIAIPLSILLAYLSFLSKLYFLHALVAIIVLWSSELMLLPLFKDHRFDKTSLLILVLSLVTVATTFLVYTSHFKNEIEAFISLNLGKTPSLNPIIIAESIIRSNKLLCQFTKTHLFVSAICAGLIYIVVSLLFRGRLVNNTGVLSSFGRAEYAMLVWLVIGLTIIGVVRQNKAHYLFFSILPICYLGVSSIKLLIPKNTHSLLITVFLIFVGLTQIPYYHQWMTRPQKTALVDTSRAVAKTIEMDSTINIIPVIGEFSAQLALYSKRILSLDAKWGSVPPMPFCKRLDYWRPKYHVNVIWPNSRSSRMIQEFYKCQIVNNMQEMERYSVFSPWNDEIVLTKIHYH